MGVQRWQLLGALMRGPRLETAVKNCLKLVPVLAVAKMDEINWLDSCAVPQLKVLTIKFPLGQKRFDSYWSEVTSCGF